jgi:hypothetical protein
MQDPWVIEYVTISAALAAGEITLEEARARLRALGFDPIEVDHELAELGAM